MDKWVDASHLVARKKRNGADLLTGHGSKASVAETITRQFEVSLATAYRYCPPNVVSAAKYTDLCVYCDALRDLRLKAARLAKIQGLHLPDLDEFVGQNEAAGRGGAANSLGRTNSLAEQFLRGNAEGEDVAELLSAVAILTERENLGGKLREKMPGAYNLRFVAVFDCSSDASLRSSPVLQCRRTLALRGDACCARWRRESPQVLRWSFFAPEKSYVRGRCSLAALRHGVFRGQLGRRRCPSGHVVLLGQRRGFCFRRDGLRGAVPHFRGRRAGALRVSCLLSREDRIGRAFRSNEVPNSENKGLQMAKNAGGGSKTGNRFAPKRGSSPRDIRRRNISPRRRAG